MRREELPPCRGAKPPILGAARYPYSISIITSYFRGMTIIRTPDRTLALKCKQAQTNGQEITIHYETPGGWNHATGIIQSVQRQRYRARPFSPFWEINLVKSEIENAVSRVGNSPEKVEEYLKNRNTTAF